MKFSFTLPRWLHWLVPARLRDDHARRSAFNGKASTSMWGGSVTITSERDDCGR